MSFIAAGAMDKEAIESQWACLGELTLTDVMPEAEDIHSVHVEDFWGRVWGLKNAQGEQPYRELAEYVIMLLSLPLSNAVVERIFSILAIVKNKWRNRLSLKMLAAILIVRAHLGVSLNLDEKIIVNSGKNILILF